MSKIHVFDDGEKFRLECWAGTRRDQAAVVRVADVEAGASWDDLADRVAGHQAEHGCSDLAKLTDSQLDEARAELDRVKTDAQVKLDAHRDEIGKLRAALRHIRDSEHYAGGEAETLKRLQHLAGATLGGPQPDLSALLVRTVRELADRGSPGQNRLAAELARDGGIEL